MAGTVRRQARNAASRRWLLPARSSPAPGCKARSTSSPSEPACASYLLRLFGTKKALFLAVVEQAFDHTLSDYEQAAKDKSGSEALEAVAATRTRLSNDDRVTMMIQLQAFAACDDEAVREAASGGYGRIVEFVQRPRMHHPTSSHAFSPTAPTIEFSPRCT